MKSHGKTWTIAAIGAALFAAPAAGQPVPNTVAAPRGADSAALDEFEGRFAYRGGTVDVVAHQGRLHAVLEDVAYPLRAAGGDRFLNGAGQPVEFVRDGSRRVVAVQEGRDRFPRLANVPTASRMLFVARPAGPYRYRLPERLNDGLAVGSAGRRTLSAQTARTIVDGVASGRFPNIHSVLVYHRGKLVLEEYFHGFDRDRPHQMRSLTKGLIALVAGAAVDQGIVRESDPVLAALTPGSNELSAVHRSITLSDLLAMRSALSCDDERADAAVHNNNFYDREDWIRTFVAAPPKAQSDAPAAYCSPGMLAAGRFVEVRSASSIADFSRRSLFRPMGIADGHWSWPFVLTSAGANEFGQVRLRPRDMMKLGVMILQRGRFAGQRILSPEWIDAMTTRQSVIGGDGYGYGLWFRDYQVQTPGGLRTVPTIMLSGNGGQKIYVIPTLDLVVVSTGGSYNQGNAPINAVMAQVILPSILEAGPMQGLGPNTTRAAAGAER